MKMSVLSQINRVGKPHTCIACTCIVEPQDNEQLGISLDVVGIINLHIIV